MKRKVTTLLQCLILFLLLGFGAFAQTINDLKGEWKGAVIIPGMDLDVLVKFTLDKDSIKGTIDVPKQNSKDLPLTNIKYEQGKVVFEIKNIPGKPVFSGVFSENKNELSGDFFQNNRNLKFSLKRRSESEIKNEALEYESKFKKIKTFIDTVMKAWKVPGVAVGIMKGDKLVFAEGFGYRNIKEKLPVTTNTLFAIGSCTKAFTSASIGILVDEGKAEWDKPVKNYYPEFKMYDNFASEKMTFRDLVTHRSGLPRHDLMWYGTKLTRKEIVERLQYLEPNKDFRTNYQYQNLMVMTAGYIAGVINGTSWEDLVKEKIFKPLGMDNSNFSVLESQKSADYAKPYSTMKDDEIKEMAFMDISTIGPAGAINSNI